MKKTWKKKIFQGCFSTKNGRSQGFSSILLVVLLLGNYLIAPMRAFAGDTATSTIENSEESDKTLATILDEPRVQVDSKNTRDSLENEASPAEESKIVDSSTNKDSSNQTESSVNSDDWTWNNIGDRVDITAYSGDPTHIIIPAKLDNKPVQIDLEGVLGNVLQKTTQTFEIEQSDPGETPVKITGTFRGLFANVNILGDVEGIAPIESVSFGDADTSEITDMSYMFAQCHELSSLDIRSLDTQNVDTMEKMFNACKGLTELNLTNFVTDNVETMASMFLNSSNLISIDVSSFNTEKVTDFSYMFRYCGSVSSLDLKKFNTANAKTMRSMFNRCHALTTLDLSSFDTSNVTTMDSMFANCKELTMINMEQFDTSQVESLYYMFANCSKLTSLDLSNFDTSSVTTMSYMFASCTLLSEVKISHFNTKKVKNVSYMFHQCLALTSLDMTGFDTSSVTNGYRMFGGCNNLNELRISDSFKLLTNFELLELPDPSNEGKTTYHWVRDDGVGTYDSTTAFINAHNELNQAAVHTYSIQKSHLVRFDLAGGSGDPIPDQRVWETKTVVDPNYQGTKAHHQFNGWTSAGETFDFQTEVSAPLELTAGWLIDTYEVRFHENTGQGLMSDQPFDYDEEKALSLNLFSKVGYTFNSWNSKANGTGEHTYQDGQLVKNLSDVNGALVDLYAQWKPNTYRIVFDTNGGTGNMTPLEMTYGKEGILPESTFNRKGYQFQEWNTDQAGGGNAYKDMALVKNLTAMNNSTVSLFAQWNRINYTVTFDSQGGDAISDQTYTVEQGIKSFPIPSKQGFTFLGWYEGDTKIEHISDGEIGDRKLKAEWEATEYKVTFDSAGGSEISEQFYTIEQGILEFTVPSRKGYIFQGWYDGNEKVESIKTGETGDRILTAQWKTKTYTITFDSNGGETVSSKEYTVETESFLLPKLEREGYTFIGWFEGDKKIETIEKGTIGDIKLKAKWEATEYNVDFDSDGGSTIDSQKYTIERGIDSLPTPSRLGYDFDGWYEGEKKIERISIGETGNRVLKTRWKLVEYRVTFDDPTLLAITYTVESDTIKLPTRTRKGYIFLGWLISEDTGFLAMDEGRNVVQEIPKGTTGNMKLVAQWQANQYTLKYNSNGGTGTMDAQTLNYNEAIKLPANQFTRTNYLFVQWNTQADGRGTTYADEQEIRNLTAEPNGSITLYAQWKPAKTALNELFNKEKQAKRNQNEYTGESWKKYQEALINAEKVLADPNATSDQIREAVDSLQRAITNLKSTTTAVPISTLSIQKAAPAAAKTYPKAGMVVSSGLMIVGLALVSASIAVWRKKQGQ